MVAKALLRKPKPLYGEVLCFGSLVLRNIGNTERAAAVTHIKTPPLKLVFLTAILSILLMSLQIRLTYFMIIVK